MYQKLQGVEVAKTLIEDAIAKDNLYLYGDPDVDGILSELAGERYLKRKYNYTPRVCINQNRNHGIIDMTYVEHSNVNMDDLSEVVKPIPKGATILNIDSGVSSARLKELVDSGYNIVSFDHHEIEYSFGESKDQMIKYANKGHYGLVINNQYSFEDPQYQFQSGCGVFLTYVQNVDPELITLEDIAMNAITLLSDSRDINNPIARQFLEILYNISEEDAPHLYAIARKIGFNHYSLGKDVLDRNYIDFKFSPFINAAMRLDLGYETIKFVNHLNINLGDVKGEQQKIMAELKTRYVEIQYENLSIIHVPAYRNDNFTVSNFIGLFANRFLENGKNIVIFCTKVDENGYAQFDRGSFRGLYSKINYRELFTKHGLIALGHPGAFGLKNIKTSDEFWNALDSDIGVLEQHKPERNVLRLDKLSANVERIHLVAHENTFRTHDARLYIKYTGYKSETSQVSPKYITYIVDGLMVSSFNTEVDILDENVFIEPVLDKGNLKLYAKELN